MSKIDKTVSPLISERWSKNRRDAVEVYIKNLQKYLRLQDWTLVVDWSEPCEDISIATFDPVEDQKYSVIRISEKFLDLGMEMQTQTLVHELIHCHLQPMTDLAEYTVKSIASKSASNVFDIAMSQSCEFATDAIADAIAPLVPQFKLPPQEVGNTIKKIIKAAKKSAK